jgi:hypothetical protein
MTPRSRFRVVPALRPAHTATTRIPPPTRCPVSARPCPNYLNAPAVCEPCAAQRISPTLRAAS